MQTQDIVIWVLTFVAIVVVILAFGYAIFCLFKTKRAHKKLTFKQWWQIHKPTKRRLIQIYAALLYNINISGFISGRIYTGSSKLLCVPGLNCYSCPGAIAACPLGALQNALASSNKKYIYYVFGIIMLYGILLGRTICGWLCPVGLGQELLFSIKTPKLKKSRFTKVLSYFKYVVLILCVVAIPLIFARGGITLPAFCKYLCPGGTLGGAIFLLAHPNNASLLSSLGLLFLLKFSVLVIFCAASVFIFRFFCRFFCPLGAIYGLFNKFAPIGIKLDKSKCIGCNRCKQKCKMDISHVGDHECINCGECVACCPTNAIKCKGLPAEIADAQEQPGKTSKKKKVTNVIIVITLIVILIGAGVYYNFLDKSYLQNQPQKVYTIGEVCPDFELNLLNGENFTLSAQDNKVIVINFWATWCGGCVEELPDFNRIASDYADDVYVLAVDSDETREVALNYVTSRGWDSWAVNFAMDNNSQLFKMLGGKDSLPITVVLDLDRVIVKQYNSVSYQVLKGEIESLIK